MWFLTHEGIDRYNGKEFKQYKLMDGGIEVNSLLNLNWLYIDQEGVLWEIGKKGKIFRYDELHDTFELVYKLPIENFRDLPAPISFAWLDENKQIWLCNEETIFLYNTATGQIGHIKNKIKEEIERYSVIRTYAAIERADVCILMIDATEGVTEQDEKIIGYAHELGKAIMVIVNKWDLIEKDDKTMDIYKKDLASSLKFLSYAKYLFISAKTGQRTHKVLEVAKECYDNYNKRIGTGILNDVVSKAILMKEPPVVALKRLKVYYATQVATKPPKFVFFVNDVNARHFSYERYLENRLRDSFDFSGTGIQIEYRERKDK